MNKFVLTLCLILSAVTGLDNIIAGEAKNQLEQSVNQVLKILENPNFKETGNNDERLKLIGNVFAERFDYYEMSKRVLGKEWRELDDEHRTEFTQLFRKLLEKNYINRIAEFSNEEVVYKNERSLGKNKFTVETRVITSSKEIPINYNMFQKGNKWVIYDVKIEGVGLIKNYRTQFQKIINKKSYDTLVVQLREKIKIQKN